MKDIVEDPYISRCLVVVFCYIRRADQILLIRRNKAPDSGRLTVVGGRKEKGEDPRQTCLREVKEETGLVLNKLDFRGVLTIESETRETIAYYFESDDFSSQLHSSEEGQVQWYDVAQSLKRSDVSEFYLRVSPAVFNDKKPFTGFVKTARDGTILSLTLNGQAIR